MFAPDKGFASRLPGKPHGSGAGRHHARGVGRSFQITNLFGGLRWKRTCRLAVQARSAERFAWWASAQDLSDINAETTAFMSYLGLSGDGHAEAASHSVLWRAAAARHGAGARHRAAYPAARRALAGLAAADRARVAALVKTISAAYSGAAGRARHRPVFQIADVVTVMNEGAYWSRQCR